MTDQSSSSSELEVQLAAIDQEIVRLANQRAEVFRQLDASRQETPSSIDTAALETLVHENPGPLDDFSIRSIVRSVLAGSQSLVHQKRVAYLGPQFSYTHQAAINYFGPNSDFVPSTAISTVFDDVESKAVDFGVVPLENSTDGRVTDTLEMFVKVPVKICGEIQLRIHHCLLASGKRSQIEAICSKPQAISQCRDWLAKHMPGVELIEMSSTAAAAQRAAQDPSVAAIASRLAGIEYGLNILDANIENNQGNTTRFAVIGQEPCEPSANVKTSLMLEIAHHPGALADAMTVFKDHQLNLTWIESFPRPESKNEYVFFVEFEGHAVTEPVQRCLKSLGRSTERHVVLGSYPKSEPID